MLNYQHTTGNILPLGSDCITDLSVHTDYICTQTCHKWDAEVHTDNPVALVNDLIFTASIEGTTSRHACRLLVNYTGIFL
jgi:hypothetical protein